MKMVEEVRWSPYIVGALIGVLAWIVFGFMDETLGVSTTFVHVAILIMCLFLLGVSFLFIRCEAGEGKAILDGITHQISNGFSIIVSAGAKHNIVNTSSDKPLKLYTLYSPPNHRDGVIHQTKADAEANEEHFDGVTTETA